MKIKKPLEGLLKTERLLLTFLILWVASFDVQTYVSNVEATYMAITAACFGVLALLNKVAGTFALMNTIHVPNLLDVCMAIDLMNPHLSYSNVDITVFA